MEFLCILKMFFIVVYTVLNIFVIWICFREIMCYIGDLQRFKVKRYHIVLPIICPIAFIIFLIIVVVLLLIMFLLWLLFIIIDWLEKPLINRRNDDSKTIE
ncbi:MAG: hypothetical protein NSGCLCUN01_02848 [uncultured Clostridium sp.]